MQADIYDAIIVGAGTAGCVLADRLTEAGDQQVLLLEAGGRDTMEMLHVPAGFNYVAFDPRVIWDYKTLPEPGLGGRKIDYVRGRVLGGSSSVNAMVHVRGNQGNYDGWAAAGCPGWGWHDVLPYFIRSESHCDGKSELHGNAGPLPVTHAHRHPATDAFIAAMVEAGIPRTADFNTPAQEGAGYYHQTVKNGRRQSGARTYLKRASKRRNLTVRTDVLVESIHFENRVATGVWVRHDNGERKLFRGRKIILSAGTVGSAQLLELSGIGSGERLSKLGISTVVHRPAVGENVQDHYQAPVVVNVKGIASLNEHVGNFGLGKQILRYYIRRDGLLAFNATQAGAFVKSSPELAYPDLQILFAPGALDPTARPRKLDKAAGVTAIVCALQPRSRGSIHITSRDPAQYPEILANYLVDEYDRAMMLKGMRLLRTVFAQNAFSQYAVKEKAPGADAVSDEQILEFCGRKGDSVHHPVGSCRMGQDNDSVVDPASLRVRGVDGLYVIDASVMPRIVSGNTNAATVMIAEKGAELLRKQRFFLEPNQTETNMTVKRKAGVTAAAASIVAIGLSGPVSAQISDDVIRIGFATDMSGIYSDLDGPGGVEAVRMAIADFGGQVNGKKIELLLVDHQNKADIGSTKAREWIDVNKVDLLLGGVNSAVGLAMSRVANEKKTAYISVGAGTARLTNEDCNPYTINYALDTIAQSRVAGKAVTNQGGKTWYFIVADYAFGHSLEKDTTDVLNANGGKAMGSIRHPLSATDFSSFLIQAQASKAQVLGLANAGTDLHNAIRAASAFGINKTMRTVAMMQFVSDTHAMGLNATQGMYLSDAWYWDLDDDSRAWSKRFFAKTQRMPTVLQAGAYSAATTYLNAVKAIGTDNSDKIMAQLKSMKINDMFAKGGYIRPDGRMVHDYYLMEVKKPSESKYPWDYYKVVQKVPGEEAFNTKAESKCPLWK